MGWTGFNRTGLRRFVPPSTMPVHDHISEALALMGPGRITDLGAGGRRIRPDVFTVDFNGDTAPDLVADLASIPLPDASFDGIFCTGTLEHVADAQAVGAEIARLLRPGGIACIDVPFMQGFHADPHDYRRWTLPGLRQFAATLQLEELGSGLHLGPASSITWLLGEYTRLLLGRKAGALGVGAVRVACLPLHVIDRWLATKPDAHRIASGVYVIARKRAATS